VVVNLSGVQYIDSSGIASLVEGLQEARKREARFVLVGLNDGPRHVLELTRLLTVFEIAATEEEAVR
jgi:anti-sigma B factor antagonist